MELSKVTRQGEQMDSFHPSVCSCGDTLRMVAEVSDEADLLTATLTSDSLGRFMLL